MPDSSSSSTNNGDYSAVSHTPEYRTRCFVSLQSIDPGEPCYIVTTPSGQQHTVSKRYASSSDIAIKKVKRLDK